MFTIEYYPYVLEIMSAKMAKQEASAPRSAAHTIPAYFCKKMTKPMGDYVGRANARHSRLVNNPATTLPLARFRNQCPHIMYVILNVAACAVWRRLLSWIYSSTN